MLLAGDIPRLIDEWQMAPVLRDAMRTSVDESKVMHTGTGRITRLKMYPMSLFESLESNGTISLINLFNNKNANIDGCKSHLTIEQLIFATCIGGWP